MARQRSGNQSQMSAPGIVPGTARSQSQPRTARIERLSVSSPIVTRESDTQRRTSLKISRACDRCKRRKQRCNGTYPCGACSRKGIECQYDTAYRRGRPPTPPPAVQAQANVRTTETQPESGVGSTAVRESSESPGGPSRVSPELETAEIEGQFIDPTSNLTFLHRAWKRLSKRGTAVPGVLTGSEKSQPLMCAGDKQFIASEQPLTLPDRETVLGLFNFYFDECVVTYRCLHQQYCHAWMNILISNAEANFPLHQGIGHAKAALIINILAIARLRQERISRDLHQDEYPSWQASDHLFCAASRLTNDETGLPRLESVQARTLHVLYLLQTGRMNQAWYVFGGTVPIVSALGLHRKSGRKRNETMSPTGDYIISQCRKRAFWVVYIIDKYLAVVFGRPRLYHDDDIDQEYPDPVNDEDMTPQGPATSEPKMDCHVDSLILHAKIAHFIDNISREVYSLKRLSKKERLAAARNFSSRLSAWRDALPAHLGTIRPHSLIPIFRRQAIALKLAYAHATMHANRPFLLGGMDGGLSDELPCDDLAESVRECIAAAKMALETVDGIVADGSLFHAYWWMPYVTFCALAVVYVWEIEQKQHTQDQSWSEDPALFGLAERCQSHLTRVTAIDSPSRRYSIILDELRLEARQVYNLQPLVTDTRLPDVPRPSSLMDVDFGHVFEGQGDLVGAQNPLSAWQATDWLDLDSSAFDLLPNMNNSPTMWMGETAGEQ